LIPILFSLYIFSVVFQLYFIVFIFTKLNNYHATTVEAKHLPAVSVIVCAWNELHNLRELIPLLDAQEYPNFEVIIVDDRSWDGSYDFLLSECKHYKNVKFIRISHTPEHLSAKKYALTLGIKSSKYDVVLLTDADCRPQGSNWIKAMAECLTPTKQIVLGFSPYFKYNTFLNRLIRYETFMTAIQYFSFALMGNPYMGVGRNLMYRKALFIHNKGFSKHTNIVGGDDDLFMNDVATQENTTLCLNPDTFMYSIPKLDWHSWYRQKRRHLSVSKHYTFNNKLLLGTLAFTQILGWVLFLILLPIVFHSNMVFLLLGIFIIKMLIQWLEFSTLNKRLGKTIQPLSFPMWDCIFTLYFLIMGVNNLIPRKTKMRWR
jgi:glycosyltransferase involved in cell wall biosynthesis